MRFGTITCCLLLTHNHPSPPRQVFKNPRPLSALQQVYEQRPEAIWQIILALGFIEFTSGKQDPEKAPGDLGFGASFKPKDEAEFNALQVRLV